MSPHDRRFDIVVGRVDGGQILYSKHAGAAVKNEADPFYSVRLNMFPGVTYFLSKNQGDAPTYTLYSKMSAQGAAVRFQNPVGAASIRSDLKTHLEIRLNLFERRLYMSLFPAD